MSPMEDKVSIIVPFYNEKDTLEKSIRSLIAQEFNKEIILINDGSGDGSEKIARNLVREYKNIHLIENPVNKGKGFAVRLGIAKAKGYFVGIFDADLEYSASDLGNLIGCMNDSNLDFVCGSRFIGSASRSNIYFRTFWANKLMSLLFSYVHKNKITDIAVCLKVFKKEILQSIELEKDGFAIEVELIAKALSKTTKYKEVPISYNARSYEEGKKIVFLDGFKYIFAIFRYK
jgi:dolichol-phosphate mannosyltransferase